MLFDVALLLRPGLVAQSTRYYMRDLINLAAILAFHTGADQLCLVLKCPALITTFMVRMLTHRI